MARGVVENSSEVGRGMTQNETGGGIPTSEVSAEAATSDMAELKLNVRQMMDMVCSISSQMGTVEREAALAARSAAALAATNRNESDQDLGSWHDPKVVAPEGSQHPPKIPDWSAPSLSEKGGVAELATVPESVSLADVSLSERPSALKTVSVPAQEPEDLGGQGKGSSCAAGGSWRNGCAARGAPARRSERLSEQETRSADAVWR